MNLGRRDLLGTGAVVSSLGVAGCSFFSSQPSCEIACFDYKHEGADDALDRLTVTHTRGRNLPAGDVYITGIANEWPPEPEEGETVQWSVLGPLGPADRIDSHSVRVKIGFVESVRILWRDDGEETVLEEFQLY
jgi:hypothetical protein